MGNTPASLKERKEGPRKKQKPADTGETSQSQYFIISLKGERIQVVNADNSELKIISLIVRANCSVSKESWVKDMTYSFKFRKTDKHCMIRLVAKTLLSLYEAGWDPLTPVDMGGNKREKQTAICFRRRQEEVKTSSTLSHTPHTTDSEAPCLCLETYHHSYIGFHDVPNTVLNELVLASHTHWAEGIQGVSMAVSSVILDYNTSKHEVIATKKVDEAGLNKFIKLNGKPWSEEVESETEQDAIKKLEHSLIACLAEEGYKLSMAINMETASRVFFFIKEQEDMQEVRVVDRAGAGMGSKDTLSIHRPIVTRSRSSFFRSFKQSRSLSKRIRASLRKKTKRKQSTTNYETKEDTNNRAWWQQTSLDCGERGTLT